ncbi:hypothetical protein NDU88_005502 [Pleurodeles waltl]|uniref:Uncharacterized protein n=1 Tax=Pleurodeles waltl TaxID=8319 RepID=A0AAV7TBJ5_PLEWA|nr:hypothetical protein NDU88_005502 [Pleurodeles waltl]
MRPLGHIDRNSENWKIGRKCQVRIGRKHQPNSGPTPDRAPERMKRARPVERKSRLTGSGCVDMTQGLLSNPGIPSGLCGKTDKMKRGLNLSVNNDRGRRSKA